ncbi:SH3 domain-containing protein [Paenibacillus sp. J5C_2022]|uniref:C40 family peptidase n=1 Tax=Paenibacillus sp. J5C2022 TaxID=2977129 RepID=UPI0021D39106|nr:SH3 domain-containing protein [Paenibacillus sp. J5C2022]MCU6712199.1 SH3 domain-containing protein [Paenibacillus sp. J5C2022]
MNYSIKQKAVTVTLSAALLFGSAAMLPAPAAYAATATAEVQWGVNMRTAPSTSGSVIRMLKKGEEVTIIDQASSGWYKVSDSSGRTGYISSSSKYTNVTDSGSSSSASGQDAVAAMNAVVKRSVSFRQGPSTSSDRIRYLKSGEQLQVTSKYNSYWYEAVDSSGVKGYVSASSKYVDVNGTVSGGTGSSSNTGNANTGGSGSTNSGQNAGTASNASVEKVIAAGLKYLGTPYEFGSNRSSTKTFDCSDFVRRAFIDGVGVTLPADSRQQGDYVKKKGKTTTNINNLKRGDLMFFMSYKGSSASAYSGINKASQRITHVGIYLGDGKILHTYSKESGGVKTNSIKGTHWEQRFLFGGSAL